MGSAVFVNDEVHLDSYRAATVGVNLLVMTGGYVGRNFATLEHVDVIVVCGLVSETVGSDLDSEVEYVLRRCGSDRTSISS